MGQVSSSTSSSSSSSTTSNFTIVSDSTLVANDLVALFESGRVSKCDANTGVAFYNNTTDGVSSTVFNSSFTTGASSFDGNGERYLPESCLLANGNIVSICNSSIDAELSFVILNASGTILYSKVSVSTAQSPNSQGVFALTGGNFVVVWDDSATLKYRVYSSTGSPVTGATSITTANASSDSTYWHCLALATGEFVITRKKATSNDVTFLRYNASGSLQGSETTIEAATGAVAPHPALMLCANGDFIVSYFNATVRRAARFTSTGSTVVAATTVFSSTTIVATGGYNRQQMIAEFSGGNIAFIGWPSSKPTVYVTTSALAAVANVAISTNNALCSAIAADIDGTIVYGGMSASEAFKMSRVTSAAIVTKTRTFTPTSFNSATNSNGICYLFPNGPVIGISIYSNNSGTYTTMLLSTTSEFVQKGSTLSTSASSSQAQNMCAYVNADKLLISMQHQGNAANLTICKFMRSAIFGVAASSASALAAATIQTNGSFTINQSMGIGQSFDGRSATVFGPKGLVVGTSAQLLGMTTAI